jgi:hypothetical protein
VPLVRSVHTADSGTGIGREREVVMIMEKLECTAGAVGMSTMRVATSVAHPVASAAAARPVAQAAGNHLLLPTVRTHSLAGVGLYEVQGSDKGWSGSWIGSKAAAMGIDRTSFPTRLGPPPDSPPVN